MPVSVAALEVGSGTFAEWYNDTQSPILVTEGFTLNLEDGYEEAGDNWQAFVTSVPLQFLRQQYNKHKLKLFSANVRDYLGSKSSDSNINNGIKKTAEREPHNFWAYNNGLTILVNSYTIPKNKKKGRLKFSFSGMSIVNGAQTTGAVSSLEKAPPKAPKSQFGLLKLKLQMSYMILFVITIVRIRLRLQTLGVPIRFSVD